MNGSPRSPRTVGDRFLDVYNLIFTTLCVVAIAASISYAFRNVRGGFLWFELTNQNAVLFFAGALLIASSVFYAAIRTVGPLAFSAAEVFWRFSAVVKLPRNPWKTVSVWFAMVTWSLVAVLLATVFAPLSMAWLVGTALGATVFGFVLIHGALAAQILCKERLLNVWAVCTSGVGVLCTVCSCAVDFTTDLEHLLLYVAGSLCGIGVMLSLALIVYSVKKPMRDSSVINAFARRSILLSSLSGMGSPQGYKYFGSSKLRLRARIRSACPAMISFLAALDSLSVLFGVTAFSIPLGIFLGVALKCAGVGIVVISGCWVTATLYRWLAREWVAQKSLQVWLGGSYLKQLFGFCLGPALMTTLYSLIMSQIFELPLYILAVALIFGFTIALGDSNPPQNFNYELTITTQDGVLIPLEPLYAVGAAIFMVAAHSIAIFVGAQAALMVSGALFLFTFSQHWRNRR